MSGNLFHLRSLTVIALLIFGIVASFAAENSTGYSFNLSIESPGHDRTEFDGKLLGDDMLLDGTVGGIETINLLTGGHLYVLTPAIKTASEVEGQSLSGRNSSNWPQWLLEPGRVNPMTFLDSVGGESGLSDTIGFGANNEVEAVFEDGNLTSLSFPEPDGHGRITYHYSNFTEDSDITQADFQIPEGYRI
jgi:hypothetical protein